MSGIPFSRARILLIISGGIAAYKSLELIRRLKDRGATVRVVMTSAAREFISPLSAATLSGQSVRDDLFSLTDEAEIGHIELSRAADLIVVAPASANILARMAAGLADDMGTTVLLATDKRVLVAPAMNVRMWLHPATRRNLDRLKEDGVIRRSRIRVDGLRRIWSWPDGRASGDRRGDRARADRRSGLRRCAPRFAR